MLRANTAESIASQYCIKLPIPVKPDNTLTRIEKRTYINIKATGERVSYLTLEAPEKEYQVDNADAITYSEI